MYEHVESKNEKFTKGNNKMTKREKRKTRGSFFFFFYIYIYSYISRYSAFPSRVRGLTVGTGACTRTYAWCTRTYACIRTRMTAMTCTCASPVFVYDKVHVRVISNARARVSAEFKSSKLTLNRLQQ